MDSRQGFGRYSLDLTATVDNAKLLGWKGSSVSVRLKNHMEEFGSGYNDASQLVSNIDAPSRTSVYELWVQQKALDNRFRLKFGKVDANTEFAVVQSGGDFLNSSIGFSPTIVAFPSYPEPKLGAILALASHKNYGVTLGTFRTTGSATLSLVEPNRGWTIPGRELEGHLNVGYWRLDGTLSRFGGGESSVTQGFYAVAEQVVWKRPLNHGERRLAMFLQGGTADGHVSPFTGHVGAGAVLQAPFGQRPSDSIGFGFTRARLSSHPEAGFDYPSELILETYYRVSLASHVAFVQDLQFLYHPGGMRSHRDCMVITPRLVVSF